MWKNTCINLVCRTAAPSISHDPNSTYILNSKWECEHDNVFRSSVLFLLCVCVTIIINVYADWKIIKWMEGNHSIKLWLPPEHLSYLSKRLLPTVKIFPYLHTFHTKWICAFIFLFGIFILFELEKRKCVLTQLCMGIEEKCVINVFSLRNMTEKIIAIELFDIEASVDVEWVHKIFVIPCHNEIIRKSLPVNICGFEWY